MKLNTERLLRASARLADAGDIPKQAAEILERGRLNNVPLNLTGMSLNMALIALEHRQRSADSNMLVATKKRDACVAINDLDGEQYWAKKADQDYNEWLGCVENIIKSVNQKKSMR